MKHNNLIILLLLTGVIYISGCAVGPASLLEPKQAPPHSIPEKIEAESDALKAVQKEMKTRLEKKGGRQVGIKPVMPKYNPLEDQIVSFSMIDEDLRLVLYSLAQAVGMNIIIDPSLREEKRMVTLNFDKVSAATVLEEIGNTFDLHYEVDGNVIRIKPFQERIFKLNFLDIKVNTKFDVGGDVLGAGEESSISGLAGTFQVTGTGAQKGNAYDVVDDMIRKVLSKRGKYSLNRLSGSLYVKDTPAVIRSVSKLINHLKDMLSRQIRIEARIIEVILSDEHSYGIDWDVLRKETKTATKVTSASWTVGEGLVLTGVHRAFTINSVVNALNTFGDTRIISNPNIRCKHGQPAIISVGTSIKYMEEKTTSGEATDIYGRTTGIEVDIETSSVFDGVILGVIPFIQEDGKITLLINPIKSDVDRSSIIPEDVGGGDKISLPRVNVKEMNTTIDINNGDVVILGGLIDKRRQGKKSGVPFFSAIPLLGYLFKYDSMIDETRELVVVLTVTVI
ncbi:MAG: pilus (MSHA type) biogenesis protein MshL [Desulfobacterales bacterium]|nr:pilus (MSHA type) biogenesis protein MshL [Desulfobacterales bacterium]